MIIREFRGSDLEEVKAILALYWTDPEFLQELSNELKLFAGKTLQKDSQFIVVEENDEILGVAGLRKLPDYLKPYTLSDKSVELYIIAVKHRGKGVGGKLKSKLIEKARVSNFTEVLLFSPNSHNESWSFYKKSGFEKIAEITHPEDEAGQVWRMIL